MTESRSRPSRSARKPGGAIVFWASAALFAALFALLALQLSRASTAGTIAPPGPVQVRKVIKRRIVTTVAPGPGVERVVSGPTAGSASATEVPVEPITTSAS